MNLIDETYFTNEIALPVTKGETDGKGKFLQTIEEQSLNRYMQKYGEKYLSEILGESLSAALLAGLALPEDDPGREIWLVLKNKLVNETEKTSPIANYVYYFVMLKGRSKTTPTGVKRAKSAHAENVSPMSDMVFAWNEMVEWNLDFVKWLEKNFDAYREYWGNHSIDTEGDLFHPVNRFNL
jgi:hypothetical protein